MTTPKPSPIIHHAPRQDGWTNPSADGHGEQIADHITRHVGPVSSVFHEILSDLVHIDVHIVDPTPTRPWRTLVTSGMSDLPMTTPEDCSDARYAELMIELPSTWPLADADRKQEDNYWPIRWLKTLARLPHEYHTWLGFGHTVPNGGEHPVPYAKNTRFCGLMLAPPTSTPAEFAKLTVKDGKTIHFWSLLPLYHEEMAYKLDHGAELLLQSFASRGIGPVLDLARPNVCKKKGWFGLFG